MRAASLPRASTWPTSAFSWEKGSSRTVVCTKSSGMYWLSTRIVASASYWWMKS